MIWFGWLATADAHPFHTTFFGHQLDVVVEADRVVVDYMAEIPTSAALPEVKDLERQGIPAASYLGRKQAELASALVVQIDGVAVTPTPLPAPDPAADTKFATFEVKFSVPLQPGVAHSIVVSNGNAPEQVAYFRNNVDVVQSWVPQGSNLVDLDGVPPDSNWNGEWRMAEASRTVTVDVAPRSGLFRVSGWLLGGPGVRIPIDRGVQRSPLTELGETWAPLGLMGFGVASVLGVAWWRRKL